MEKWLLHGGDPPNDLVSLLYKIEPFENVSFTFEGEKYNLKADDVRKRIHSALCPTCNELRGMLYIQKNKLTRPLVKELIKTYIDRNYVDTKRRVTFRNDLYQELDMFLKSYHYTITRDLRRYITHDLLKDNSTQYRPFKIQKRE